ncbi:ci repressor-like protein [Chelonobacter oris]|uniref:DNA-binding protein n=1 Tax=Chelonobacter oris TaxID=505317 RepID=UPI00244C25E3|nr:DNA-binding protein [Chelonobacter oris]MDH3001478.1 ci repressor-like protein [Chelonobacter oris]
MKEWELVKNLLGIGGLPNTPQGVLLNAKKGNWQRRRVKGVKGNVFEYYVGDMPLAVQHALGFKADETNTEPLPTERVDERLKSIDRIMAAISSLEAKVKDLEEPTLDSLPDTLDQAEKRLVRWFRQCNKDRQAMLLSSAEVLAGMTLSEEKEKTESFTDPKVA